MHIQPRNDESLSKSVWRNICAIGVCRFHTWYLMRFLVLQFFICCHHKLSHCNLRKKRSGIFSRSDFIQEDHSLSYFIRLIKKAFVVISSTWCFFVKTFIHHSSNGCRTFPKFPWEFSGLKIVRWLCGPWAVFGHCRTYPTSSGFLSDILIATMLYRPLHLPRTIILSPTIGNEGQWSGCHATSNCLCNSKSLDSYATRNQLLSLSQLKGNDKKNTTVA